VDASPKRRDEGAKLGPSRKRRAQVDEPPVNVLPLIIDRKRTSRMFGFDYTMEIYVPAAKRRYGY